jgi:uncharacterized membrane protein
MTHRIVTPVSQEPMELNHSPAKSNPSPLARGLIRGLRAVSVFITRRWLWILNGFFALLLAGALVTPLLMRIGWTQPAKVLYTVYSFTCHQLPERSYFLFTPEGVLTTYEKDVVVAAGADPTNVLTMREFVGTPEIGYKAAFSDRMFSMYGGALLGGVLFAWLARRGRFVEPLPVWALVLLATPMAIDGFTHLLSDLPGMAFSGFRDVNAWATPLFGAQPENFYTGSTTGTLNAWLRLVTGLLFGVGIALFAYPYLGMGFYDINEEVEEIRRPSAPAEGV